MSKKSESPNNFKINHKNEPKTHIYEKKKK